MTTAKHSKLFRQRRGGSAGTAASAELSANSRASVPVMIASAISKLNVERRARLRGRLLGSVGPLALAVVSGGVFAKYLPNAGWPKVPISFEDAARATSTQVQDLVRYVEQSNPDFVESLQECP